MDTGVMAASIIAAVGVAQAWVRVGGGPGAALRDRAAPPLRRLGLEELTECAFCTSVWLGLVIAGLAWMVPGAVYGLAIVFGPAAVIWFGGGAPRREQAPGVEIGCRGRKAAPAPPAPTPAAPPPAAPPGTCARKSEEKAESAKLKAEIRTDH